MTSAEENARTAGRDGAPKPAHPEPPFRRTALARYGTAVAFVLLAAGARAGLDPVLHGKFPFLTFLLAVIGAAWFGGFGPSLLAAGLGGLAAAYLFLPPQYSLLVDHPDDQLALLMYAIATGGVCLFGRAVERSALQSEGHRRRLEREVGERRRAEEELRLSRQRLELAQQAARIGTFEWDVRTDAVSWSGSEEELYGLPRGGFGGRYESWRAAVHPDDRDRAHADVQRAVAGRAPLDTEFRVVWPDGTVRWLAAQGQVFCDERGAPRVMLGVNQDVTDRKQAERLLDRYRLLSERARDIVLFVRPDGRIAEANAAAVAAYGYDRDTLLTLTIHDLRDPATASLIPAQMALADDRGVSFETVHRRKDGRTFPVEVSSCGAEVGGERLLLSIVRDATDRKLAERRRNARLAVTQILAEAGTLPEAAPRMLRVVCESLGWDLGSLWAIDRKRHELHCAEVWHGPDAGVGRFVEATRAAAYAPGVGLPGWVWQSGAPVWVPDFSREAAFPRAQAATADGLRAAFGCPVVLGGQVLGVLDFYSREAREPDPDLLEMMATLGGQVGQFLERRQAEARLREETRVTETLHRIGSRLAAELDLHRLVQLVTDEATRLTDARFGAFFYNVHDERGESYTLHTLAGAPREAFDRFPPPRVTALFEPTFRGRGVVRLDDVTQDPRYGQNAPHRGMPEGHLPVRSYLAVPVASRSGEVLGGLFFGHPQAGVFTARHERLVVGIAAQAAVAIDNARLYQRTQESEQRFRQLAEHVSDVFWVCEPDPRRVLYVNPAFEAVWGRSCQSLYDDPRSFLAGVHPDDRPRVAYALDRQARGETTAEEYRVLRPDGSPRWVWERGYPVRDEAGRVARVVGVAEDVTERKRDERALRFLSDASEALAGPVDPEGTMQKVAALAVPLFADWCAVDLAGPDGRLRRVAVAHTDTEKVRLAHELQGRYPPDPDAPRGAAHVARTGRPELVAEIPDGLLVEVARDEGHLRLMRELGLRSYICVPLGARGQVLGVVSFVSAESGRRYDAADLRYATELARRAGVALENAGLYAELREADRRKDEFLATLAHELRNPLAPIRNAVAILKGPCANGADAARARDMMERQLRHLVRLVDDLLDVSRIVRGKIELRTEPVELRAAVESAVETAQPLIDAQGHALAVSLPAGPVWLEADAVRLSQVIANLLTNAAKYTEPGGRIDLAAERVGDEAVVRVSDTGIGIEPELLPRVFEPFVQEGRSAARAQGGLGIGLTLVRGLVQMHGGSVSAHSEGPGRGSEFVVRLPAPRGGGGRATDESRGIDSSVTLPPPPLGAKRVLVVDDNADAAESLAVLLRMAGHTVATAHTGPQALEAARAARPEVVVLDIGLPGMDGYEVARRLREQAGCERALLVALTGWGQEEDRRRSREAGFDLHLVKPVELEEMLSVLAAAGAPAGA
jgi:PAS domain S-box-containing protein